MADPQTPAPQPRPPRGRYQFSLSSLFLVTALVSVLAAALGGMVRARFGEVAVPGYYFLMMAVAAPMATMIALSLGYTALRWFRRRRR